MRYNTFMSNFSQSEVSERNMSQPERDAVFFFFDMTRQFITISIGAIGFLLGMFYTSSSVHSSVLFWAALVTLGASVLFGLLYFMRGVGMLSVDKVYDVYTPMLRMLSIFQITLTLLGIVLVCFILGSPQQTTNGIISIRSGEYSLDYPHNPNKKYKIDVNAEGVSFSTTD